jgi:hypothetical protein
MSYRPICVECGIGSPDTNTNYTLISRTGWRLTRGAAADGSVAMEWRCPSCWAKHKATPGTNGRSAPPPGPEAPRKRAR